MIPQRPLANYPILKSYSDSLTIIGLFDNYIIDFKEETHRVDIINGQLSQKVVLSSTDDYGAYHCTIYNCMGEKVTESEVMILTGVIQIKVPVCGLIRLKKNSNT